MFLFSAKETYSSHIASLYQILLAHSSLMHMRDLSIYVSLSTWYLHSCAVQKHNRALIEQVEQGFFTTIFLSQEHGGYLEKNKLCFPGYDALLHTVPVGCDACSPVVSLFGFVGKDGSVILSSLIWYTALNVIKEGLKDYNGRQH